jgi:hypothetical protein
VNVVRRVERFAFIITSIHKEVSSLTCVHVSSLSWASDHIDCSASESFLCRKSEISSELRIQSDHFAIAALFPVESRPNAFLPQQRHSGLNPICILLSERLTRIERKAMPGSLKFESTMTSLRSDNVCLSITHNPLEG